MLNKVSIRNKVRKAIQVAPTNVTVYRPNKVDDGYGGYIIPEDKPNVRINQLDGVFTNSSRGANTITLPGGIVTNFKPSTLLVLWEEGIDYRVGDFMYIGGIKYTVTNPINVSNLDIIWQLEMSSKDEEKEENTNVNTY